MRSADSKKGVTSTDPLRGYNPPREAKFGNRRIWANANAKRLCLQGLPHRLYISSRWFATWPKEN